MKIIIIVYFCVALLLPIVIRGDESFINFLSDDDDVVTEDPQMVHMTEVLDTLDGMVRNGGNISNIFVPRRLLRHITIRIIYEGELFRNGKTVAMKFGPLAEDDLRKEYEMYSYLGAIDNATVESYGIPAVYYYGEWNGCRMLAITLLQRSFHIENDWSVLNTLILFREFVRISKYMHSRGVYHRESIVQNIMFRGNKGFMIHFKRATKVPNGEDYKRAEWEYFIRFTRFSRGLFDNVLNALPDDGLKRVIVKFSDAVHSADPVDYDEMHDFITEEIRGLREPALVSWLMNEQRDDALAEWNQNRAPDIRAIPDPYTAQFDYTPPNYAHFVNRRQG